MMPSFNEIISKIIIAAIITILARVGKLLWKRLVRNWPGLRLALKTGANRLDKFLDKKAFSWHLRLNGFAFERNSELSYRELFIMSGRLAARSVSLLFDLLALCSFYLSIVVHHFSVEKALLLAGTLSLCGRFMRWYMYKMIAS